MSLCTNNINVLKYVTNSLLNNKQRWQVNLEGGHPFVLITDMLGVTFNTKLNFCISFNVLQLHYVFRANLGNYQV